MLIDFISVEKLPNWLVWLDWNIYAYYPSFVVCIILGLLHYYISCGTLGFNGVIVGVTMWVCYIAFSFGYGVG